MRSVEGGGETGGGFDALVSGIAEDELDAAFVSGEGDHLSLLGGDEDGDIGGVDGFAGRIGLDGGSGGEDENVLEDGFGDAGDTAWGLPGDEDIDAHAGQDEAGDADDVVDADGDGAHADGDDGGEAETAAALGEAAIEDRFIVEDITDDGAVENILGLAVGALGEGGGGHLDDFQVGGLDRHADGEGPGGDDEVSEVSDLGLLGSGAGGHLVEDAGHDQSEHQAHAENCQKSAIHSLISLASTLKIRKGLVFLGRGKRFGNGLCPAIRPGHRPGIAWKVQQRARGEADSQGERDQILTIGQAPLCRTAGQLVRWRCVAHGGSLVSHGIIGRRFQ